MIKSQEIDKYIHNVLFKRNNEELTDEDLKKIKKIVLSGRTVNGEKIVYDFSDLIQLENIESCTLEFFDITDEIVSILANLTKLKTLTLNHCKLMLKEIKNGSISSLIISHTDISELAKLKECSNLEMIQFISVGCIDINHFSEVKSLKNVYIYNSEARNFSQIKELPNLEKLGIDGTKIDDECVLDEISGSVDIHNEEGYLLCSELRR